MEIVPAPTRQGVTHMAISAARPLLVAITPDEGCYVRQQLLHTDFPGPMYPSGYTLVENNTQYDEAEDEFDVLVTYNRRGVPVRTPAHEVVVPGQHETRLEPADRTRPGDDIDVITVLPQQQQQTDATTASMSAANSGSGGGGSSSSAAAGGSSAQRDSASDHDSMDVCSSQQQQQQHNYSTSSSIHSSGGSGNNTAAAASTAAAAASVDARGLYSEGELQAIPIDLRNTAEPLSVFSSPARSLRALRNRNSSSSGGSGGSSRGAALDSLTASNTESNTSAAHFARTLSQQSRTGSDTAVGVASSLLPPPPTILSGTFLKGEWGDRGNVARQLRRKESVSDYKLRLQQAAVKVEAVTQKFEQQQRRGYAAAAAVPAARYEYKGSKSRSRGGSGYSSSTSNNSSSSNRGTVTASGRSSYKQQPVVTEVRQSTRIRSPARHSAAAAAAIAAAADAAAAVAAGGGSLRPPSQRTAARKRYSNGNFASYGSAASDDDDTETTAVSHMYSLRRSSSNGSSSSGSSMLQLNPPSADQSYNSWSHSSSSSGSNGVHSINFTAALQEAHASTAALASSGAWHIQQQHMLQQQQQQQHMLQQQQQMQRQMLQQQRETATSLDQHYLQAVSQAYNSNNGWRAGPR
jgi:hypothetical protein